MTTKRETQLELENARLREALDRIIKLPLANSERVLWQEDPLRWFRRVTYHRATCRPLPSEIASKAVSTPSPDPSPVLRLAAAGLGWRSVPHDFAAYYTAELNLKTAAEALTPEDRVILEQFNAQI